MGRFGHYTLVPARDAVEGVGHVWVPYSATRSAARRGSTDAPLTRTERSCSTTTGSGRDAGRARGLGDGAVSARESQRRAAARVADPATSRR